MQMQRTLAIKFYPSSMKVQEIPIQVEEGPDKVIMMAEEGEDKEVALGVMEVPNKNVMSSNLSQ
jgi:hypothetical protein